jgi:hypothetical protein
MGDPHTKGQELGLAEETAEYLARHWATTTPPAVDDGKRPRGRARRTAWKLAAAAILASSLVVYVCGLVFLARLF